MAWNEKIISAFMDESSIQPQIKLCQTLCFTFIKLFPLHSVFKFQAVLRLCTAPTSTMAIFQSNMFEADKNFLEGKMIADIKTWMIYDPPPP